MEISFEAIPFAASRTASISKALNFVRCGGGVFYESRRFHRDDESHSILCSSEVRLHLDGG